MKPFKSTTMLRPLTRTELQLEDPQWEDDDTISFYIPCWFNVDRVFSGLQVVTDENDDYINLYCACNTKTQSLDCSLFMPTTVGRRSESRILRSR